MRAYRFIYYRLFAWNLRMWGPGDLPQYNACVWLALVSTMNLLAVGMIAQLGPTEITAIPAVVVFGVSLIAHLVYFVHSGRYERLAAEFRDEPPPRLWAFAPLAYSAGSPLVFLLLVAQEHPVAA